MRIRLTVGSIRNMVVETVVNVRTRIIMVSIRKIVIILIIVGILIVMMLIIVVATRNVMNRISWYL